MCSVSPTWIRIQLRLEGNGNGVCGSREAEPALDPGSSCVASDKLLGLSESQVFHVCSRGLDWTDSMCSLHL